MFPGQRIIVSLALVLGTAALAAAQDGAAPLAQGPAATAEQMAKFEALVASHGGLVERVPASDPRWKDGVQGRTYLDLDGRPRVLLPQDAPVRSYALVEELTHVIQLDQARAKLGADGLNALLDGVRRGDTAALNELTRWEIAAKRNILLTLSADHPDRAVLRGEIDALQKLVRKPWVPRAYDPLQAYRLSDGRLDWARLKPALKEQGAGLASFTLALFLRELAAVLESGDQLRIGEFFDQLVSLDFFAQYGLFAVGAQGASAIYAKHLQPLVLQRLKSQFLSGVLRSQLALAAGLALPRLVRGELDGRRFAVDLGALGLSALAVRSALQGAGYVTRVGSVGRYLQGVHRASRLASVPGWIFQAGETALVLYFGDQLQTAAMDHLDRRDLEQARAAAEEHLLAAARGTDEGEFAAALESWAAAWEDARRFEYRPLAREEARLQERLAGVAKRLAALEEGNARLRDLARQAPERYQSLMAASGGLTAGQRAAIEKDLAAIFAAYQAQLPQRAQEVYGNGGRLETYARQRAWLEALSAPTDPAAPRARQLADLRAALKRQEAMDRALYAEFQRPRPAPAEGRGIIDRLKDTQRD